VCILLWKWFSKRIYWYDFSHFQTQLLKSYSSFIFLMFNQNLVQNGFFYQTGESRVLWFLRLTWKILSKQNLKLCCYSGISVRCSCAHGVAGGQVPQEPTLYVNSARVYDNLVFEHSRDCLLLRQRRRLQTACSDYFATTTTTTWLIWVTPTLSAILCICFYLSYFFMFCSSYLFFMIPFYMHVQKLFFSSWLIIYMSSCLSRQFFGLK
jgi:hypothetical protein